MTLNRFSGSTYSLNSTWSTSSSLHTAVSYVKRTDKKFVANLAIILAFTIGIFCFMARIYSSPPSDLTLHNNELAISEDQFKTLVELDEQVGGLTNVLKQPRDHGDYIFTKTRPSKNCSVVYGKSRLSNIFGLTKVMQESTCKDTNFFSPKGHGCWCSEKPLQGKPLDDVDNHCRSYHLCERCVRKSHCGNLPHDFSFSYKWDGESKFMCTDKDECSKNMCECAMTFGNDLIGAAALSFEKADASTCGAEFVEVSLGDIMPRLKMVQSEHLNFVNIDEDLDESEVLKASVVFADEKVRKLVEQTETDKPSFSIESNPHSLTQESAKRPISNDGLQNRNAKSSSTEHHGQINNEKVMLDTQNNVTKKKDSCCKVDIGRWVDFHSDEGKCEDGQLIEF